MAAVSKTYGVGDTVYVHYTDSIALQWLPVERVVSKVRVNSSSNEAVVEFTTGESVVDGATVRVYTTQVAAVVAMVSYIITQSAAVVAIDTTTSVASTAGNTSTTLGRIG